MIAPAETCRSRCWTAEQLCKDTRWIFDSTDTLLDGTVLVDWSADFMDPIAELQHESVATPHIDQLAERIRHEIHNGSGIALVRGLPFHAPYTLRLIYMKLGLALGTPIGTYGRLYEVKDVGVNYRVMAVPVSQTRESTGMHTDSSNKDVLPTIVGLACVRPAPRGGGSRLVSAVQAHENLRCSHPRLLERLYGDFVRDIVTPGGDRSPTQIAENRFPVFSYDGQLRLRYMRYWIERGHDQIGEPLDAEAHEAFDALDAELSAPRNVLSFNMKQGEMLFINNTLVAHDRDAYEDNPIAPRLMLRMWLH